MTFEIVVVFLVLGLSVLLFVFETLRHDIIGLLVVGILGLTRVLDPGDLFEGFSNRAVITIGAMFVMSAALTRTGAVAALGGKLAGYSQGSPLRFLILCLTVACFMSAFVNNTPVVVVFIPAVLTVCTKLGQSPSKFLIPLSFASMLGGSCTLIGTSSNILISSIAEESGQGAIGMFEFSLVGIFIVFVGMAYLLLFSFKFLPERITLSTSITAEQAKEYVTQVRLDERSHIVGKTLGETPFGRARVSVVELIRDGRIRRLDKETPLEVDDILLVRGDLNEILELDRQHEISIASGQNAGVGDVKQVEMTLFELMIPPNSELIGATCKDLPLQNEYGVSIFALQRHGKHHQKEIGDIVLRMGDILLVRGPFESLERLRESSAFTILEGVQEKREDRHKAPIAITTIAAIVLLAGFGVYPISVLSIAGVGVVVLTGLLSPREVYRAIDWPVLVLIGAMIALGHAMEKTGALDLLAGQLIAAVGGLGPTGTLWVFYFLTALLSLLILNKPAAALATPLGIILAVKLQVDPKPFIMAVAFAASTAMATPMGYQTNLLVYGPGGYNYKDFVKFGLPLNIALGVVACLLIPVIWKF